MAPSGTHLIDLCCFKPPEELQVNFEKAINTWRVNEMWGSDDLDFIGRVYARSGLSESGTYLPPAIHPQICGASPMTGIDAAKVECEMCVCGAVQGLLDKSGILADEVDILVTTCSIFCPTPSMASMVVNKFKMRSDIQSYHLGGMGCSNGVVAVNLITDLLKAHKNVNAVLVTTEVTTPAFYQGRDRNRLVTNVLFRMGAAAILFSNKLEMVAGAKYRLLEACRVHVGAHDEAFGAIHYGPDQEGINGIYLGKNVVNEASRALTIALWRVVPRVITWRQAAEYAAHWLGKQMGHGKASSQFVPRLRDCVQHFVIHAGGAKVLDGIGKALRLEEYDVEPSRAVLSDYGNISSSSTWYTVAYLESTRGVKRGERVMQVGVGSGIKCGVNVWTACRDIQEVHKTWRHRASPAGARRTASGGGGGGDDGGSGDPDSDADLAGSPRSFRVDVARLGWHHAAHRGLFMLVMLVFATCLHAIMFSYSD